MADDSWHVTGPLTEIKSTCGKDGSELIEQVPCSFNGWEALQTIVHIKAIVHGKSDIIPWLAVIQNMLLHSIYGTAGAAGCSKWEHLPFINARGMYFLVTPKETEEGSILWQEVDLVEHLLDVPADAHWVLTEP